MIVLFKKELLARTYAQLYSQYHFNNIIWKVLKIVFEDYLHKNGIHIVETELYFSSLNNGLSLSHTHTHTHTHTHMLNPATPKELPGSIYIIF